MKTLQQKLDIKGERVWQEFCLLYPRLIRHNPPKIILNNRLRTTAGRCDVEENTVELSTKFLTQFETQILNETLPHEFAHQIDYIFNGYADKFHHGKAWRAIMVAYGLPPLTYHTMKLK